MTFFQPNEAPSVHIEQLPPTTLAVNAEIKDYVKSRGSSVCPSMYITAWTTSKQSMSCVDGENDESFVENYCNDCEFHCDDYEIDSDGNYSIDHYDHGNLRIWGTIRVESPCPCYNDGLGEVEFPCANGHDGPGGYGEISDRELSLEYMTYGIYLTMLGSKLDDAAYQQSVALENDVVYVGSRERAINTFDGRDNICWGTNDDGLSLLEIESLYKAAPCNEDLLSFDGHDNAAYDCTDPEDPIESAIWLGDVNHRPRALACATALGQANSFVLMASAGVKTNGGIAYIPVSQYKNVAIDDDTVLDVWVSDETPVGKRLMFLQYGPTESFRSIYLGQIDNNFNLEPCTSQLPQSSAQAELVNS